MIDLHTHILPGIDDGVESEDEAVELARVAMEDGVRLVVATPHCREGFFVNDRESVLDGVRALRARLAAEGLDIRLEPGAEVHICPDLPERIRDGRAPTLGDNGRTLLLELSLSQYPVGLNDLLFQLRLTGTVVLMAHPERIRYFQDDPTRYAELVRMGAYGQVTTGSLLGTFGQEAREFSEQLARNGLVHVLASDAHNLRGRPPRLVAARDALTPLVGEARARAMVEDAPRALLNGTEPQLPPVEGVVPRRSTFLSRWFGSN